MKKKNANKPRLRIRVKIRCSDEIHELGICRNGTIVYLSHRGQDLARLANFCLLGGGEMPACTKFKTVEDLTTMAWAEADAGLRWELWAVSKAKEDLIFALVNELREKRRSKAAGEAKRSRRLTIPFSIGLRKQKCPPPEPKPVSNTAPMPHPFHKRLGKKNRSVYKKDRIFNGSKTKTVYVNQDAKTGEKRYRLKKPV